MIWKKIIYAVAFLSILAMLGAFNRTEASSLAKAESIQGGGHKFGGRKAMNKKNKRNRKILKRYGLAQVKRISGESC